MKEENKLVFVDVTKILRHPVHEDLSYTLIPPVNLELHSGESLMLKGPSGSGKTTFLNMISRDTLPSSGYIQYNSLIVQRANRSERVQFFRKLCRVDIRPEENLLFDLTPEENLKFILHIRGVKDTSSNFKRFDDLLGQLEIEHLRGKQAVEMSGGELQRLSLALALSFSPEVLICDEPTAHLDRRNKKVVWDIISEFLETSGAIGVITTHDTSHPDFKEKLDLQSRSW